MQWIVRGILRLGGVRLGQGTVASYAEEELRGAIELHKGGDRATRHERSMLHSILDLGDVEVSEVMVHRSNMVTVDAGLPPAEIVREVVASPYTRLPLWREKPDNIVGVLHAKALLKAVEEHAGDIANLDIAELAAEPWFIPESTDLLSQLQAFRRRGEHFALVVDEYGDLLGIVTLEDILEEIVGDISDETDVPRRGIRPQRDGTVIADGDVTIRDLNRRFDWTLPDEGAATVAGLVLHESRLIPEPGTGVHVPRFPLRDPRAQGQPRHRHPHHPARAGGAPLVRRYTSAPGASLCRAQGRLYSCPVTAANRGPSMPLSAPKPRTRRHKRVITLEGYEREDGLWDIEGQLVDTKDYDFDNSWRGRVTAGTAVHNMRLRLTVDDTMTVREVDAAIDAGPHQVCPDIAPAYQVLVGERIKPGWNLRVRELLGGVRGCVHLVEMLGPIGTVAYQTMGPSRAQKKMEQAQGTERRKPARLDTCHAFASDGEIVRERWPEFYTGPK